MLKVELSEVQEYSAEYIITRYEQYANHMTFIFPDGRIKILPYARIRHCNIYPITAESGAEG